MRENDDILQYIYTPEECGLPHFSDGTLRLNFEQTTDPLRADVFVVPESLTTFKTKSSLRVLPHLRPQMGPLMYDFTRKHVFLDISEHFTTYDDNQCIFIRAALTKAMLDFGPNSISWPYPVDDFKDAMVPKGGFQYDVTFHGFLSNLARKVSVRSCQTQSNITSNIRGYPNFFGYQSAEECKVRRERMLTGLQYSRLALCQESIPGVLPYRFYEAMSAGRCQLYIGHNFNLPFADKIDYHQFVTFLNIDSADEAGEKVREYLDRYDDGDLIRKGKLAREAWDKWLRPDKWVQLMTDAVEERINARRRV